VAVLLLVPTLLKCVQPTVISSSRRSQEEQDGISTSLVSFITLGSINIERHPDFLDFCNGFNVALEPSGTPKRVHHVLEVSFSS
jgi:hypothetical protein